MFYHTQETINVVTENLIKRFCGDTIFLRGAIDIDGFIYDFLNYDVVYDDFGTDCLGESAFLADGKCELMVWRSGKKENVLYPSHTIVLDRNYLLPKNECKRRFALAHEAGHIILDTVLCGTKAQAAFKTEFNTDRFYTFAELRKILSAKEYQANLAASALLMPKDSVISFLKKHIASDKIYVYGENILSNFSKEIIEALAKHFKVSYSAMYIRLNQLNLFEYKSMDEYVNIDIYREEEIL